MLLFAPRHSLRAVNIEEHVGLPFLFSWFFLFSPPDFPLCFLQEKEEN